MKTALLAFHLAFVLVCYVWRVLRVSRQIGRSADATFRGGDFQKLIRRLSFVTFLLVAFNLSGVFFDFENAFGPIEILRQDPFLRAAWSFWIFSIFWTALAQSQMGRSWRLGVDPESRTQLVEKGLFSVSRNPIYVGVMAALFAIFLGTPNAVTSAVLVSGFVLIRMQIALEEEFLTSTMGEGYLAYCKRVRRWI